MEKLTQQVILMYAATGIRNELGCHPCPNEYPEEIAQLKAHLEQVTKRLTKSLEKNPRSPF